MGSNPLDFDAPNPYADQNVTPRARPPRRGRGGTIFAAIVVLGIGLGGGYAYLQARNATLHLVNGLDVAVTVSVDGRDVELEPRSLDSISVVPGPAEIVVTGPDGEERSREEVEVPSFTDVVAYNVAGAAALFASSVTYREINIGFGSEQREDYAGQTFITRDDVDYVFEEAPQRISISSNSSSVTRWQFLTAPDFSWMVALNTVRNRRGLEEARALLERVQEFDPDNPTLAGMRVALGMDTPNRGGGLGVSGGRPTVGGNPNGRPMVGGTTAPVGNGRPVVGGTTAPVGNGRPTPGSGGRPK